MKSLLPKTALAAVLALFTGAVTHGQTIRAVTAQSLPNAIVRPGHYDLQPSVLFDAEEPNPASRFKMWWLGHDPASPPGVPGDRIYFAYSADGVRWEKPVAVLAPQLGSTGRDAADDHLLGSPSVLKIQGRYYMFYEAYGTYATAVNRFFHPSRGDSWTTHGFPQETADWNEGYTADRRVHGFAPRYAKAQTHPIYSGEIVYSLPTGPKANRFLRQTPVQNAAGVRPLNGGEPVFWLYDSPGPGRQPLFSFWGSLHWNTFTSTDPSGEGVPGAVPDFAASAAQNSNLLGYLASSLDTPDMVGSLQNRIMLATSPDGLNWTRFQGAGRGGAIVVPVNERTSLAGFANDYRCPNERWDIHRAYGCGFPAALVRDGWLELYSTDDTADDGWLNRCGGFAQCRVRLPVAQIENPAAYTAASAQRQFTDANSMGVFYGEDIKWSPLHQRYFVTTFDASGHLLLVWSDAATNPEHPPTFPRDPAANNAIRPGNIHSLGTIDGRWAGPAGIASTGLGQTPDFSTGTAAAAPYSALHLFFESGAPGDTTPSGREIGHNLAFVWSPLPPPPTTGTPTTGTPTTGTPTTGTPTTGTPTTGTPTTGTPTTGTTPSPKPPVVNVAPKVSAGPDRTLTAVLPAPLTLTGQASDDGLPAKPGRLSLNWSRVSGAAVSFTTPSAATTTVNFSTAGTYILRLTANDGERTAYDDVTVTVVAKPNLAPSVNAGPDRTLPIVPGQSHDFPLTGSVKDDGLPGPTVTTVWSVISGPGEVRFRNPASTTTSVWFSQVGQYVLRLTANDGKASASATVTINVTAPPGNNAIDGTVTSYGGGRFQVASGAKVAAMIDGIVVATATADARGHYTIRSAGIGSYSVRATWNSYRGELPNCALFKTPSGNPTALGCNVTVR